MITSSFGTFFWLMSAYVYFCYYKMQVSPFFDILFISVVIVFMYFINQQIMAKRCGVSSSVVMATLLPWLLIFLPFMGILHAFPEWKKPFSNTFGYLVVYFTSGVSILENLIKDKDKLTMIFQSPALLINQFLPDTFEAVVQEKYTDQFDLTNLTKVSEFKDMLRMKDVIATWIWYLLIASITTSTSYVMLMNSPCTQTVDDYMMSYAKSQIKNK